MMCHVFPRKRPQRARSALSPRAPSSPPKQSLAHLDRAHRGSHHLQLMQVLRLVLIVDLSKLAYARDYDGHAVQVRSHIGLRSALRLHDLVDPPRLRFHGSPSSRCSRTNAPLSRNTAVFRSRSLRLRFALLRLALRQTPCVHDRRFDECGVRGLERLPLGAHSLTLPAAYRPSRRQGTSGHCGRRLFQRRVAAEIDADEIAHRRSLCQAGWAAYAGGCPPSIRSSGTGERRMSGLRSDGAAGALRPARATSSVLRQED